MILSHIMPLEACNILLERPEKFDRTHVYHGHFNKITFTQRKYKFAVSFSIPLQIEENQMQTKFNFE